MPGLSALYPGKKRWRLPSDPLDYLKDLTGENSAWRENCSSVAELAEKVMDLLDDQAKREPVTKLSEPEARDRCPV